MKPGGGAVPLLLRCTLGPPGPQAQGLAHKAWPTRPGPRTAKHFAWKILACLQLREEGVLETAGAGESVQC